MEATNIISVEGGFDTVLQRHEMAMGVQYIDGSVAPYQRNGQLSFRGLVLSSQLVIPIADDNFVAQYDSLFAPPTFFDANHTTVQLACIVGYGRRGIEMAWSKQMTPLAVEINSRAGSPVDGAGQNAEFLAAMAQAFPAAGGAPPAAQPAAPPFPPPGTPRPLVTKTNGEEGFLRFSWVTPDLRVNSVNGTVSPGTYAAPYRDGIKISSGLEAVGRFALYVVLPAKFTVLLTPPPGTAVELGAVAPAHGQAGGGVEGYFPAGFVNQNLHYHRLQDY